MFFNEIAMVPSHSNLLHEFTHTEVAAYSAPTQKQALVVLLDSIDDRYTRDKVATMEQIFSNEADLANKNIVFLRIDLDQPDFLKKFFYTHFFMVYIAYFLAQQTNILGRDLISLTAKNPWWSQKNIDKYESCIDIPSEL
jgi:glucose/mannose-6-phosphate isomerase